VPVPEQHHVQPAVDDRPQFAGVLELHEGIVAHERVMMEEEELNQGRIVRVAQNGIQTAQLPVADLPAGKVERHLGLQVAVQSDEHDRLVARLDDINHRRVAARKGPTLPQGFGETLIEQLGPIAVIDETDGAEVVVPRTDEHAASESGKRFSRPTVLLCIAVVRDVAGHDQVMRRIPLFDPLEQLYGTLVVVLAAMKVKIADVDKFHNPLLLREFRTWAPLRPYRREPLQAVGCCPALSPCI
jgi:hypothetical protein